MTLRFRLGRPLIRGIQWSERAEDHIWERHRLTRYDVAEALWSAERRTYRRKSGSETIRGRTRDGRLVEVVFASQKGFIRPITAYEVTA